MMPPEPDDDFLDGCDLDFAEAADDEETQSLRSLFPLGTNTPNLEAKAQEWEEVFSGPELIIPDEVLPPGTFPRGSALRSAGGWDTGIADRLRAAGLKVVEVDGWRTRGSSTFSPRGAVHHHTAGARTGNAPSLGICINGRAGLPGPLCNVLMGRDNTCYVIAAGRANHAGAGSWQGLSGNSSVYGLEHENVGTAAEPWRGDQVLHASKCLAALIRGRTDASKVPQHKEWAPTRKIDCHSLRGADVRAQVALQLNPAPQPAPTPPTIKISKMEAEAMDRLATKRPFPVDGHECWDVTAHGNGDHVGPPTHDAVVHSWLIVVGTVPTPTPGKVDLYWVDKVETDMVLPVIVPFRPGNTNYCAVVDKDDVGLKVYVEMIVVPRTS